MTSPPLVGPAYEYAEAEHNSVVSCAMQDADAEDERIFSNTVWVKETTIYAWSDNGKLDEYTGYVVDAAGDTAQTIVG
jgi:hypothetical protein